MKILHVVTLAELGGAQSVVLNLAKEAIVEGHEVLVASSVTGELWNALPPAVKQLKIQSLKREISLSDDIMVVRELRSIHARFKPDIVHLHSSKIGILGRLAFPASKIVYTVHGFDSIRIAFRKFLYLERTLQNFSKHIVGVSKYDVENLKNEGIVRNVKCIYNGIQDSSVPGNRPENSCLAEAKAEIRAKKTFKILCIARISPQKKFDLFCEIAEKMKGYPIDFFWVGNKEAVNNTPENVHCLGQVTDAHLLLKEVDLFILPTNYEGMPISIIEALCNSVPVVASNVGGIPEMLDGTNGLAVENHVDAFVSAISGYFENPELLAASRLAARLSYESHFTVQAMFAAYLGLYQSMIPTSILIKTTDTIAFQPIRKSAQML